MKPRHKRLIFILAGLAGLGVASALILKAFQGNLIYFYSPSDVMAHKAPEGRTFRVGGLVQKGSVMREGDGTTVQFVVTDLAQNVKVKYTGILPDLFKEGQGAIAQGHIGADGVFVADQVLAKHDEKYMPPEVADALKKAGKSPDGSMNMTMTEGGAKP